MSDPYRVLGVAKDAPHAEIKRAFRRLARQYHPDRNPDDAAAEERFKSIQSAWEQLETPEKRRAYDEAGRMPPGFDSMGGMDLNEMLRQFMGGASGFPGGARPRPRTTPSARPVEPTKGTDIQAPLDLEMAQAASGGKVKFTVNRLKRCDTCEGRSHGTARGCSACSGIGVRRRKSQFTVNVPAGANHGQQLRLPKMGNEHPSGPPGDLIITLRIDAEAGRRWEGERLIQEVEVPYSTLMLGGSVRISTPAGAAIEVKVAAASRIGDRRRLPGQGFNGGDLDIEYILAEPTDLSPAQREALEQLRDRGL